MNVVLSTYAEEHARHARDPQRIGYAIDALLPFWTHLTIDKVTKGTCRRYVNHRKSEIAERKRQKTIAAQM